MKLAISIFLLCRVAAVLCFCGERGQNTKIFRAALRGVEWLKNQQRSDGSWGDLHTTGSALLTLRLAGMEPLNKTAAIEYMRTSLKCDNINPQKIYPLGQLAAAIHGIQALCQDPRDFAGYDWIQKLKTEIADFPKKDFDNYFQYSIAVSVLCNNNEEITLDVIKQLIKEGQSKDGSYPLGEDVTSASIMALKCIHNTQSDIIAKRRHKIYDAIQKATRYLLKKKEEESLINTGNQHTLALFVQAMLTADKSYYLWLCSDVMMKMLSYQEKDGSFGTVLANIQVIPALIGALPSDLQSMKCEEVKTTPEPKMIATCIRINFGDNNKTSKQVDIEVPQGTTAYQGLVIAAKKNNKFVFVASKTTFGHMITSICGVAHDAENKYYWMLHDEEKPADVGVDQFELREGKCAVFKYQKLDF